MTCINQRTSGPVNAHLMSWPSKVQNLQNLEIYGKEMTLTFNTHIINVCIYQLSGHRLQQFLFFIQFNVPFNIISLIETSQSIGGAKRGYPGKNT